MLQTKVDGHDYSMLVINKELNKFEARNFTLTRFE